MKKVALFATVLALALAASAQEANFRGPNVILPNARHARANAEGMTTIQPANAQSASATAQQGPVAKVDANAIHVGATAPLHREICLPLIMDNRAVGPPCK